MLMKTCNRCLCTLMLSDFSFAKTCVDGVRNYCKDCQSLKKKEWYSKNKEHVIQKTKEYSNNHPEVRKKAQQNWISKEENKQKIKTYKKEYGQLNKDKINSYTAARRKRVQLHTPPWETIKRLQDFYLNCPAGYQVDHIIPLNNKYVCGLHTIDNLQYLTPTENYKKGNKYAISS